MKKRDLFVLIFCLIFAFIGTLFLSKHPDFDWYSYHFYNGWAFLENRYDLDFMPSQFRTYFNPVLDAINFFFIKKLNNYPYLFLFVSSLKYSIFLFLAYKIYDLLYVNNRLKKASIITSMFLVILSPVVIFVANFDYTDLQVTNMCLLAMYILMRNIFSKKLSDYKYFLSVFFAGLLFGASVGFKYTALASVLAVFVALILTHKYVHKFYKTIFLLAVSTGVGFFITNGWWMLFLWHKFQNPFFPYFNDIFKSGYAQWAQMLDIDIRQIKPNTFVDFIFFPLYNTAKHARIGWEVLFRDIKFTYTFTCSLIGLVLLFYRRASFGIGHFISNKIFRFLLFYLIFTYYINQFFFANVRYIAVLYAISPIIILSVIYLFTDKRRYIYFLGLLALSSVLTIKLSNSTIPYKFYLSHPQKVFEITRFNFKDGDTVLCGNFTSSFLVPFQENTNVKMWGFSMPIALEGLRKEGYWYSVGYNNMYFFSSYLENLMPKIIENSKGLVFLYADNNLGKDFMDFKFLNSALQLYSDGKYSINNCTRIKYFILGDDNPIGYFYACRLK